MPSARKSKHAQGKRRSRSNQKIKTAKPRRQLFKEREKSPQALQYDKITDELRESIPAIDIYSNPSTINFRSPTYAIAKDGPAQEPGSKSGYANKLRQTLSSAQEDPNSRSLPFKTECDYLQKSPKGTEAQIQMSARKQARTKKQRNLIIKRKSLNRQRMQS